jgi:hypothetical protein
VGDSDSHDHRFATFRNDQSANRLVEERVHACLPTTSLPTHSPQCATRRRQVKSCQSSAKDRDHCPFLSEAHPVAPTYRQRVSPDRALFLLEDRQQSPPISHPNLYHISMPSIHTSSGHSLVHARTMNFTYDRATEAKSLIRRKR